MLTAKIQINLGICKLFTENLEKTPKKVELSKKVPPI